MRIAWVLAVLFVPALRADEPAKGSAKTAGKTYEVPYRLTKTQHILIRAKINGKGPYNFILDTGAPALFIATKVCDKLGVKADKQGWGTFDRFELEGGLVIEKAKGRIEDPFQLEGMNALGLAGAELHGMIGYQMLARYKMELDFTKNKLAFTKLDFEPKPPQSIGGKGGGFEFAVMEALMKILSFAIGDVPKPEVVTRGFLGVELDQTKDGLVVKAVLEKSPAAEGGIKVGDRITHYAAWEVPTLADLRKRLDKRAPKEHVTLKIVRDGETKDITLKLAEGL